MQLKGLMLAWCLASASLLDGDGGRVSNAMVSIAHRGYFSSVVPENTVQKTAGLTPENIIVSCFRSDVLKDFKRQMPQSRTLWLIGLAGQQKDITVEELIATAKDNRGLGVVFGELSNGKVRA